MKSLSEVMSKFPKEVLDKYDFSSAVYFGALVPIENVVCKEHGAFKQYSARFRKGWGCQKCGLQVALQKMRTPAEDYIVKVAELHAGKYGYSKTQFTKMNSKIVVICPQHGEFSILANNHYYRKQGCGECEIQAKKARIVKYRHLSAPAKLANAGEFIFDRLRDVHEGKYTYPEQEYKGAKNKIQIICPEHGLFEQAAWNHLSGRGCPKCGAYSPAWEQELFDYLTSKGLTVTLSAPVLDGREIDLYIPERRFGIELHGLRWHTERTRPKMYHYEKWQTAHKANIRLIQVFEDEWNTKKDVVLSRIDAMLGLSQKYDARKCTVVNLEASEAKSFLDKTHIQGGSVASLYYGLKFRGELVAVASFSKTRGGSMTSFAAGDVWEVLRYASIGRVRGGFSRLFNKFKEDVQPIAVISYCDLRYGNGKLYEATGFTLGSITQPDYWWVPNGKVVRIPRYATQKHKLPSHPILGKYYTPGKTESQTCADAGWERIWGVGHQKWIWKQ